MGEDVFTQIFFSVKVRGHNLIVFRKHTGLRITNKPFGKDAEVG